MRSMKKMMRRRQLSLRGLARAIDPAREQGWTNQFRSWLSRDTAPTIRSLAIWLSAINSIEPITPMEAIDLVMDILNYNDDE